MSDISRMTTGVLDNLKDIATALLDPARAAEFGPRECGDLNEAYLMLSLLLSLIEPDLTKKEMEVRMRHLRLMLVEAA